MNFDESTKGKRWEVVGAWIANRYTTPDIRLIRAALDAHAITAWITREEAGMMAWADLGAHWRAMAQGKALFVVNEEGVPETAGG